MTRQLLYLPLFLFTASCVDAEPKAARWGFADPDSPAQEQPAPVPEVDVAPGCMSIESHAFIDDASFADPFYATAESVVYHRLDQAGQRQIVRRSHYDGEQVIPPIDGLALGADGSRVLVASPGGVELIDASGTLFEIEGSFRLGWPAQPGPRRHVDGRLATWQGFDGNWVASADVVERLGRATSPPYVGDGAVVWTDAGVMLWTNDVTQRVSDEPTARGAVTSARHVFWRQDQGSVWGWRAGTTTRLHDGPCGPIATHESTAVFTCEQTNLYRFDGFDVHLAHASDHAIVSPRVQAGVIAWAEFATPGQMEQGTVYIQRAVDGTTVEVGPITSAAPEILDFVGNTLAWTQHRDAEPRDVGIAIARLRRGCEGGS